MHNQDHIVPSDNSHPATQTRLRNFTVQVHSKQAVHRLTIPECTLLSVYSGRVYSPTSGRTRLTPSLIQVCTPGGDRAYTPTEADGLWIWKTLLGNRGQQF